MTFTRLLNLKSPYFKHDSLSLSLYLLLSRIDKLYFHIKQDKAYISYKVSKKNFNFSTKSFFLYIINKIKKESNNTIIFFEEFKFSILSSSILINKYLEILLIRFFFSNFKIKKLRDTYI